MMKRLDPPPNASRHARQLWRVVDGAIVDALNMHPDYLTPKGARGATARRSIAKRVVGSILGFVEQSTEGRRMAAESDVAGFQVASPGPALSRRERGP